VIEISDAHSRSKPEPGLYIVATPIGNLRDVTLRALDLLAAADAVACEDTRVTAKLMRAHRIKVPLLAYHEHNAERMRPILLDRLARGERIALVADAGTPLVSDPGYKLVRAAVAAGIAVYAAPGASAALAALVVSALPSDRFFFAGFLPPRAAGRRHALADLAAVPGTLVFYESPRRLAAALADMAAVLGPRPAAVARELTKLHEQVRRGPLGVLADHYADAGPPRGEVVVVVAPPAGGSAKAAGGDAAALDSRLRRALREHSVRDAADIVAAETGRKRREVYARAVALAAERGAASRRKR